MNSLAILAQTAESIEPAYQEVQVVPIDFIWTQITSLTWLQAIVAISFGVVYLMYGWRIFKILVVISFALVGLYLGIRLGGQMGPDISNKIWGGVIGLALLAGISVPLMKWCVCILGAIAGGTLTGGLWYAFEQPQAYIWVPALIGVVAGGMIGFIVLKASVMLFTSLGGSAIVVVGFLALLHLYESSQMPPTEEIRNLVYNSNWFLPVALIVPTAIGVLMQNKLVKHSSKWEM